MEEMGDEMHAQLVKYRQIMDSMEMGREYLRHLGVQRKQILVDMWKLSGRNAAAVARIVGVSHTPIYEAVREISAGRQRKVRKLNDEGS